MLNELIPKWEYKQKIIDRACWLDIAKFFIIDTLVLEKTAVYKIFIEDCWDFALIVAFYVYIYTCKIFTQT